jgi:hypothetical protein
VILLRAFLVPQAPGRRRGTEVRAAIASAGSRRPARSARCETTATATRPWSAEATTAAWTRSAEPTATAESATAAGAWAAEAATARARAAEARSGWTWTTILASTRFADRERPPLEWLCVELANDFFRLVAVRKLDERKSAWASGLSIDRHSDVGRLCDGREVSPKISLTRTVGEVPDEQTDCQGLLVKSPLLAAGFDSISKTL